MTAPDRCCAFGHRFCTAVGGGALSGLWTISERLSGMGWGFAAQNEATVGQLRDRVADTGLVTGSEDCCTRLGIPLRMLSQVRAATAVHSGKRWQIIIMCTRHTCGMKPKDWCHDTGVHASLSTAALAAAKSLSSINKQLGGDGPRRQMGGSNGERVRHAPPYNRPARWRHSWQAFTSTKPYRAGGAEALKEGAHVSKAGLGPQLHPGLQHQVPHDLRRQALLNLANHHSLHQATRTSAGPGAVHRRRGC